MNTRKEQREEKQKERIKRGMIWSIYVFISCLHDYLNIKDFYNIMAVLPRFERELESYKRLTFMDDFQQRKSEAIKEYERQHSCRISKDMREMLNMPSLIIIDEHALCLRAALYFKEYWDKTLQEYKQKKARFNRLNYLIDIISGDVFEPAVKNHEDVIALLEQYREEYKIQRDALGKALSIEHS